MREVIERLLKSDLSAYEISKQTGVNASAIQRLRAGKQTIDESKYSNIEKLTQYQIQKEMSIELNDDRYSQYRNEVVSINKIKENKEKFDKLKRLNGNIVMALKAVLHSMGVSAESGKEQDVSLFKMIELLNLNEGIKVRPINENATLYTHNAEPRYFCIEVSTEDNNDIADNVQSIIKGVNIISKTVDFAGINHHYKIYTSDNIDDIEEAVHDYVTNDLMSSRFEAQQIIDRCTNEFKLIGN